MHHRIYEAGQAPGEGVAAAIDLTVPADGELSASVDYTGLETGVRHFVEASMSGHFPHEATATVSFVPEDRGVFVATVVEQLPSGEFHLAAGTGIGLVGCHEGEDVMVTLWSDTGEELESYLVDVLPTAPAAAAPPSFASGHIVHRVAVVNAASRDVYFAGGEAVATVAATGGTAPLSYRLAAGGRFPGFRALRHKRGHRGRHRLHRRGRRSRGPGAGPDLHLRGPCGRRQRHQRRNQRCCPGGAAVKNFIRAWDVWSSFPYRKETPRRRLQ